MKVHVMQEEGLEMALRGMAYSYFDNAKDVEEWWRTQAAKSEKRAALLCHRGGGHSKFLESVILWLDVEATRGFWSQFDTYRIATKQSTSTMHTLGKRRPILEDFSTDTPVRMIEAFQQEWDEYQEHKDISVLKAALPEGFLQRRMVCLSYKTLQNIIAQRSDHRLGEWPVFCQEVLKQVKHPEFLVKPD